MLEYLTEEVVRRQPEPVQRFLMQTSILGRLCGPLCNALTDESDGEAMLAHLRRRNLFVLPLDDEHHWYRYHHLFADLLGNLLRKEWPPEHIRELHLRACEWHDRNGLTAEAVSHALAAGDFERVAQLIEHNSLTMVTRGELTTLLRWIDALPDGLARSRPWLCVHQAWPLTFAGKADAAEPLLQRIEQQVSPAMKNAFFFAQVFLPGLGRPYTDAPYRWWFAHFSAICWGKHLGRIPSVILKPGGGQSQFFAPP